MNHPRAAEADVRLISLYLDETRDAALYAPWTTRAGFQHRFVRVRESDRPIEEAESADLVIYHEYWRAETCRIAMELVQRGKVPVLMLPDGILEYRCVWDHPAIGCGIGFMPVAAHKVACLGASQARWIESWGATGRCEVVGLPRLDGFATLGADKRPQPRGDVRRILVMTARTPAFTEGQWGVVEHSLRDVARWFEDHPEIQGVKLEPVWRVAGRLSESLGLSPPPWLPATSTMADALSSVDAVMTTPSTAMLEAMLKAKPVALIDYHNTPPFVPAAWTVSAREHIGGAVHGMLANDPRRMLCQTHLLHDNLACEGDAATRMIDLITAMARHGRACREAGRSVAFPPAALLPGSGPAPDARGELETADLFPAHPHARDVSVEHLQALCSAYHAENARLAEKVRCLERGVGPMKSWLLYRLYRKIPSRKSGC